MLHNKTVRRILGVLALLALLGSMLAGLVGTANAETAPDLAPKVKSAILLDYTTGEILYEKNADLPIPPASLTKLMTLHLAYRKIAEGAMKKEDKVQVREQAWAAKMIGSSVMWLEPGQNVTVGEIMKGIAIPSGNDASIAMAQHIAGSVDQFVNLMNQEAKALGFTTMKFADPHGLSPQNMVTAKEFAQFSRMYIEQHPEALAELHSVVEYTYPQQQNAVAGKTAQPILQYNRNTLLGTLEGVDGLKTGFIEESGYNIALTAKRGDTRFVAVILGATGASELEGSRNRAEAGSAVLQWGFQNFITVKPALPQVKTVRVWKGAANELTLEPEKPVQITVTRGLENKLVPVVHQESAVVAPVKKGDKLGEIIFSADGKEVSKVPLVAAADVGQGGFFKRLWDSIRLTVAGWFNRGK